MIDCAAIGDSIGYGTGLALGCEIRAQESAHASRIIDMAPGIWHKYCIISAGSNDVDDTKLLSNLDHIRNQLQCQFYIWIEPINSVAAKTVEAEASLHFDKTVTFVPGSDNVHPASYSVLAGTILNVTGN